MHSACREESLQVSLALALGSNPRVRIGIRGAEEDHTPSALDLHAFFVSVMHAIGHRSSILNMQYKPLIKKTAFRGSCKNVLTCTTKAMHACHARCCCMADETTRLIYLLHHACCHCTGAGLGESLAQGGAHKGMQILQVLVLLRRREAVQQSRVQRCVPLALPKLGDRLEEIGLLKMWVVRRGACFLAPLCSPALRTLTQHQPEQQLNRCDAWALISAGDNAGS